MAKKKKAKQKKSYNLCCPVCHERRSWEDTPFSKTFVEENSGWAGLYYAEHYFYDRISWACKKCLEKGDAIKANRNKQKFGIGNGVLAYTDIVRKCRHCKNEFVFTKEEQRHWYETLQFWIDSTAKECQNCRKDLREIRDANTKLGKLLHSYNPGRIEELREIAELYSIIGAEEKAALFDQRAAKLDR